MTTATKYACYARVSTEGQTTEGQRQRLEEHCNRLNLPFDFYEETESTRKTRPIKAQLLADLRNGRYLGVIVYKLDRWARSSAELILELQELTSKGIAFISISDNIDFTTAAGKLHFQILSAFAEFERSLISERTKEGLRRVRASGTTLGRPKGKKDTAKRNNAGYLARFAKIKEKLKG